MQGVMELYSSKAQAGLLHGATETVHRRGKSRNTCSAKRERIDPRNAVERKGSDVLLR